MQGLLSITFENFKSFSERTEISFEATKGKQEEILNLFSFKEKRYLKLLSIHGLNSAGKTNLMNGVDILKNFLLEGIIRSEDILKKIEGFKFFNENHEKPTTFEIKFFIDNIVYQYGLSLKAGNITKEFLFRTDKRKSLVFERENWKDIKFSKKYLAEEDFSYIPERFKKNGIPLLSILLVNTKSGDLFNDIRDYFDNFIVLGCDDSYHKGFDETFSYLDKHKENRSNFSEMMKSYELGMEDFLYRKEEEPLNLEELKQKLPLDVYESLLKNLGENSEKLQLTASEVNINVVHKVYDNNKNPVDKIILDFDKYTSQGTKKLYSLAGAILKTLEVGGVLIIDELDGLIQTLHVENILRKFQDEKTNPFNAQLIFTGHNPYIIDSANLRRDQVLLVKKNKYGESKLTRLSDDKKIKPNNSFSKSYLNILKNELSEL